MWHYQPLLTNVKDAAGNEYPVLRIHEFFEFEKGNTSWTVEPITPDVFHDFKDGEIKIEGMREELIEMLEMMLDDAKKYPVLDKRE